MRIEIVADGRVFQGTPKQIVMQMKSISPGPTHLSMREFVERHVTSIACAFGVDLTVTGETDDDLASSFLEQLLAGGYARRL